MKTIGQYEILDKISQSATTTVYKAYQKSLDRWVLIKVLHPHLASEEELVGRFQREAKACARIKHENIVDVFDYGVSQGMHFMAMEFVHGTSLRNLIEEKGRLPLPIALRIALEVLKALGFAHSKGVYHRDVKPSNILIGTDGSVKLTDFGLSYIEGGSSYTVEGTLMGTPAYMSPEQARGEKADGRSDLFSLGATVYEMLTGEKAFGGDSYSVCLNKILTAEPNKLEEVTPDIPEEIVRWLRKMLEKDVAQRYQTCEQSSRDLRKNLSGLIKIPTKEHLGRLLPGDFVEAEEKPPDIRHPGRIVSKIWSRRIGQVAVSAAVVLIALVGLIVFWQRPSDLNSSKKLVYETDKDTIKAPHEAVEPSPETADEGPKRVLSEDHSEQDSVLSGGFSRPAEEITEAQSAIHLEEKIQSGGEKETISLVQSAEGYLQIICLPWAKVYIDGQYFETTPIGEPITLAEGTHQISFVNPNFSPILKNVHIKSGEEQKLEISFLDNVGYLMVIVNPWADVYVDNEYRNSTPLSEPLIVEVGEHILSLKNPAWPVWEREVRISKGDTLELRINLED